MTTTHDNPHNTLRNALKTLQAYLCIRSTHTHANPSFHLCDRFNIRLCHLRKREKPPPVPRRAVSIWTCLSGLSSSIPCVSSAGFSKCCRTQSFFAWVCAYFVSNGRPSVYALDIAAYENRGTKKTYRHVGLRITPEKHPSSMTRRRMRRLGLSPAPNLPRLYSTL